MSTNCLSLSLIKSLLVEFESKHLHSPLPLLPKQQDMIIMNSGRPEKANTANSGSLKHQGDGNENSGAATIGDNKNTPNPSTSPPAPNSKPRETDPDEDTYVYRDFATIPAPTIGGAALHPQSLQAQKLPAKLASMLSDHDLASVILWMPHGRSWRVLNRDLFAEHALPRYFGHKNYASFVRIVNAWGFRRITRGPDRDSYYHELFLRGRPDLHQRMKRLSTCHRKTPVHKEDKCPDFYELAKTSPLPDVSFQRAGSGAVATSGQLSTLSPRGIPGQTVAAMGSMGGGQMRNINEQVLSLLTNDPASRSMNAGLPGMATNSANASLPRLAQLQLDNEDLRRRIMEMEGKQQAQQGMNQQRGNQQMIPDQLASLSANIAAVTGTMSNAPAPMGGGGNHMFGRDIERMQRGFMMQPNNAMNNSMNTNTLLSSLGGAGGVGLANVPSGAGNAREFSFMTNFPRNEMLIRAMRLDNQPSSHGSSSSNISATLERALQQNNTHGGLSPSAGVQTDGNRAKVMMDWMAKQQQQGSL